jgi:hypothetical protein
MTEFFTKNEQPGRVASERRTGLFSAEDAGPLMGNAVFISDQRVFALKRTAILRIEMLKRVHDAKGRVSITGYGVSRTEPAIDSGFQCN